MYSLHLSLKSNLNQRFDNVYTTERLQTNKCCVPCGPDFGVHVKEVNDASPLSLIGQTGINSQ